VPDLVATLYIERREGLEGAADLREGQRPKVPALESAVPGFDVCSHRGIVQSPAIGEIA
jgi:hypothetical protein